MRDRAWLVAQWDEARVVAGEAGEAGAVLALDEIQSLVESAIGAHPRGGGRR